MGTQVSRDKDKRGTDLHARACSHMEADAAAVAPVAGADPGACSDAERNGGSAMERMQAFLAELPFETLTPRDRTRAPPSSMLPDDEDFSDDEGQTRPEHWTDASVLSPLVHTSIPARAHETAVVTLEAVAGHNVAAAALARNATLAAAAPASSAAALATATLARSAPDDATPGISTRALAAASLARTAADNLVPESCRPASIVAPASSGAFAGLGRYGAGLQLPQARLDLQAQLGTVVDPGPAPAEPPCPWLDEWLQDLDSDVDELPADEPQPSQHAVGGVNRLYRYDVP